MANSQPPQRPNSLPALTEETLKELLSVQKHELTVRLKEVERDSAEINLNRTVAQQSIEAQERDRKHEREELTKRQRTRQNFMLLALAGLLVFSAYAMFVGQSALVLDFAKVVVGFVGGMGYYAIRHKKQVSDE